MTPTSSLLAVLLHGTSLAAAVPATSETTASELLSNAACTEALTADCAQQVHLIDHYQRNAASVVRGTVVSTQTFAIEGGSRTDVSIAVKERIRGKKRLVVHFSIDTPDEHSAQPALVQGYDVIAFADKSGWVLDGNAIFAVEDDVGWLARRAGIFAKPSADRDWTEGMDPLSRYVALPLDTVREAFPARRARGFWR